MFRSLILHHLRLLLYVESLQNDYFNGCFRLYNFLRFGITRSLQSIPVNTAAFVAKSHHQKQMYALFQQRFPIKKPRPQLIKPIQFNYNL